MIGSVLVIGAVVVAPLAAHAVPGTGSSGTAGSSGDQQLTTTTQVNAKLAELAKSSEQLAEKLNAAKIDIAKAQQKVVTATRAADLAQSQLRTAQQQLAVSLASQYKAATFSRTIVLLSSNSSDNYLQTMQTMTLLSQHQSQVATIATNAIAAANTATAAAKSAVTAAQQKQAALVKQQSELNAQTTKYKALLATLTAAERAKYFTPAASVPSATSVGQAFSSATPGVIGKGPAAAIAEARAQLGKPYVWDAAGPDSFDCSGLTMYAWAAAGVSLPHNAAAQQGMGTPVNESDLQPGDLVFFGSPAYHVGLYIGDGMMIHAPTEGDVVKIVPLSYMSDYSGATRVG